ncbi:MAG: anti-sigma factor [Hyphomicrobiaceae bacterium]|nr:anti-sigma factor [Hyphomicrobiaceae bacterium]
MTDRDDIDMLAAEYALGTLDAEERARVAARRQREPELEEAIVAWEERLSPLLAHVGDATPRADLLDDIKIQVARRNAAKDVAADGNVISLSRRLARWRAAAISAGAIAASLAGFIIYKDIVLPPPEQNFVAVFQEGDKPPQFVLSINLASRELTIRPIAAPTHPGKTYQLWIASDKLGSSPQSLGLLDTPGMPTRKQLRQFDPKLLQGATFGISLEPEGGSPTGKPTGPALHGKLIPTAL